MGKGRRYKSGSRIGHPDPALGPFAKLSSPMLDGILTMRLHDSLAIKNMGSNLDKPGFNLDVVLTSGDPKRVT